MWTTLVLLAAVLNTISCTMPYFTTSTYPVTLFFTEGTATPSGTVLHTFHAEDAETDVVPFLNYTYDPSSGTNMFLITETNTGTERTAVVTLKDFKEFDYETLDTYKITAYAYDGVLLSDGVLVTIQINDTGETPTLNPATTSQSFQIEENPAGTVIGDPNFAIVDGDGSSDNHVWSITGGNGSSEVTINPVNGTIVLTNNYDRDTAGFEEVIAAEVTITDKYGLSVTTTYYISITDKNDNTPQCSPTLYTFNVSRDTPTGTVVASVTCTDADVTSPNNEITYSFVPGNDKTEYYNIDGSNVSVAYVNDLIYGGGPYQMLILAIDGGSPAYTSTVTLSFTIPDATTLPPTTTVVPVPSYDPVSSDSSLPALIIIVSFVAACLLGYVLILCWRWHTFGACLPRHCPTQQDCRMCCTCCPGDDIELDKILSEGATSDGYVVKKENKLGPEALNSK